MYRDPVESLSAECARLRAELEHAQADADVARRMTAPQRTIWTVAAVGAIAASIAVCVMVVLADERAHAELRESRADVVSLERAVGEDRREYMELQERLAGTRDTLASCQDDLADALKGVHRECQLGDPLCEPLPVSRRAMR
jgi:hypothetical protein